MMLGYIVYSHPVLVKTANCQDFWAEFPEGWDKRYTGVDAYEEILADLFDNGQYGAYYEVQSYWGQSCNGLEHSCGLALNDVEEDAR